MFRPAAFALAQRALAAAAIFARTAAENLFRAGFAAGAGVVSPFCLAQRSRCASPILRRAAADIVRRLGVPLDGEEGTPFSRSPFNSAFKASILSRRTIACLSVLTDRFSRLFIMDDKK